MNRRTFITAIGAGLVLTSGLRAGPTTPEANPATPESGRRPAPVDLGSGITLVDYRVYPATPHYRIIGEIRNTTDRMIDAPVVNLYYPVKDEERAGFAYAPPMLPVMEAGGSVPIFGTIPDGVDPEAALSSADFALCTPAEPGEWTAQAQQLELRVEVFDEDITAYVYRGQGQVSNESDRTASGTMVRGIVRDAKGRIAGSTTSHFTNVIGAGDSRPFALKAGGPISNKANPFVLLAGDNYSVEIVAGPRGPVILTGCSFGKPWD